MSNLFKQLGLASILFLLSLHIFAQSQITINLAGQKSVVKAGSIKGEQYIDYKVSFSGGTNASIALKSSNTANYFNILAPGSTGDALYNSSINGNSYLGELRSGGVYTIRVYLMGAAARRNEQAKYTLNINAMTGSRPSATSSNGSAASKATSGKLQYTAGTTAPTQVNYSLIRLNGGSVQIKIAPPGLVPTILVFKDGEWECKNEDCKVTYTKSGHDWHLVINDYQKVIIPDSVILSNQ